MHASDSIAGRVIRVASRVRANPNLKFTPNSGYDIIDRLSAYEKTKI
jgi:hypothetical protein